MPRTASASNPSETFTTATISSTFATMNSGTATTCSSRFVVFW